MQIPFPYEIPINFVIPSFRALLYPLKWKQKLPISEGYHTFPKRIDPKDNEKPCLVFSFEVSRNFVSAHGSRRFNHSLNADLVLPRFAHALIL